jgi:hypothetical protein
MQLVGVSGGEKTYIKFSIIIKFHSIFFSLAIGEQDRMDRSRGHWMTCSIIRTCHQSWLFGCFLTYLVGVSGEEKIYLGSSIIMNIYSALSLVIGGWDRMDCRRHI